MSKQHPRPDDMESILDSLPPAARRQVEPAIRSGNPRAFLRTLKSLRAQLDRTIERLEEKYGEEGEKT